MIHFKARFLLASVFVAFTAPPCHADGLVGLWQSETNGWFGRGHTNSIEALQTIEFFKDQSFKITEITVADGKRWTNVPYTGTYSIVSTNRASLRLAPHELVPGAKPATITVLCSILGNELELPKLTSSVIPEYQRFRRVK